MVQASSVSVATGEWECAECGYVEEGLRGRRPAECPECGAPSAAFDFYAFEDADEAAWEAADLSQDEFNDADIEEIDDENAY